MTVAHVDRASRTRPIVIAHANGHLMNVNSAMLGLAAITRDNEVEGVVKFDGGAHEGEPTGELQEPAAMFLVLRRIGNAGLLAPMTDAGVRSFARLACMLQGVTTATDLVNKLGAEDCATLETVLADDTVSIRILPAFQAFHGTHGAVAGAEHVKSLVPRNTDRLRYGLVKMMLDGSIQGFSARLRWPGHFNGAPNGIWVVAPSQYEADFEVYHRAGLTIHTHTNGDEASEARDRRDRARADEGAAARPSAYAAARPDDRRAAVPPHGRARPLRQPLQQSPLVLGRPALRDDDGPGPRDPPRRLRQRTRRGRAARDPFRRAGDAARAALHRMVRRQPHHAQRAACSARPNG